MKRLSIGSGIFSIVMALLVLALGVFNPGFAGSDTFTLALIPLMMAVLFSLGNFIYSMLAASAADESEEKALLAKRKESHALNVEEDVRFTAERSFRNYSRFAPYVLSVLGALILLVSAWIFWRYWGFRDVKPLPESSLRSAFISALMMCFCALPGAFLIGQARSNGCRWLRSIGSWQIMAFVTFLLAAAGSVLNYFEFPGADDRFAGILLVAYLVLAAEFVLNFIIEFYRPRTIVEERPLFESRFLALFTEPGGVMRNIADMLDYQFGFKVSGTWIYAFIERALYPLLIFWVVILWAATSVYEVGPNQVGFKVSFGKVDRELLEPGIYFSWPWPFGEMRRFSTTEIQTVTVGGHGHEHEEAEEEEAPDDGHGHAKAPKRDRNAVVRVVTWTNDHSGGDEEEYFLLSARSSGGSDRAMQIALAALDVPIEYRIRRDGVFKFACDNADTPEIIEGLAQAEVVKYLAGITFEDLLTTRRQETGAILRERIQAQVDHHDLGVDIVHVDLLGIHPPGQQVAPKFEEVYAAREKARTMVYRANSYQAQRVPQAQAEAWQIVTSANSYKDQAIRGAEAESRRFEAQLTAYLAMPEMFKLRSYLDFLQYECAHIRKFIVPSSLEREVLDMNFEVNPSLRLLDSNVSDITREY